MCLCTVILKIEEVRTGRVSFHLTQELSAERLPSGPTDTDPVWNMSSIPQTSYINLMQRRMRV